MEKCLLEMQKNVPAIILKILIDDPKIKNRLTELGIFEGAKIVVLQVSPQKSSIIVGVRGYCLCIDSKIASAVVVND